VDSELDAALDVEPDPSCEATWVASVGGEIVSEDGQPVAGANAQLCVRKGTVDGTLVCLRPVETDDEGVYDIEVPESARCMGAGTIHAYDWSGSRASMYCHVDVVADEGVLSVAEATVLFAAERATSLPPWGDPSEARTVSFVGGLEVVDLVPDDMGFDFDESRYDQLGAASVDPEADGLCFLDAPVDALWAFSVEANVDKSFRVRVPNANGLSPGEEVDLFVLGGIDTTLSFGTPLPEGEWRKYGAGVVSEDGSWIEGDLPAMTWFGYAAR
jgi:hypothetical protein